MEALREESTIPVVPTPEEQQEKPAEEPPTPKVVKVRKPRAKKTTAPTIMVPGIDDKFGGWSAENTAGNGKGNEAPAN